MLPFVNKSFTHSKVLLLVLKKIKEKINYGVDTAD